MNFQPMPPSTRSQEAPAALQELTSVFVKMLVNIYRNISLSSQHIYLTKDETAAKYFNAHLLPSYASFCPCLLFAVGLHFVDPSSKAKAIDYYPEFPWNRALRVCISQNTWENHALAMKRRIRGTHHNLKLAFDGTFTSYEAPAKSDKALFENAIAPVLQDLGQDAVWPMFLIPKYSPLDWMTRIAEKSSIRLPEAGSRQPQYTTIPSHASIPRHSNDNHCSFAQRPLTCASSNNTQNTQPYSGLQAYIVNSGSHDVVHPDSQRDTDTQQASTQAGIQRPPSSFSVWIRTTTGWAPAPADQHMGR